MTSAFQTYWMARLQLVSEITTTFHVPEFIKTHFKKYTAKSVDATAIAELGAPQCRVNFLKPV